MLPYLYKQQERVDSSGLVAVGLNSRIKVGSGNNSLGQAVLSSYESFVLLAADHRPPWLRTLVCREQKCEVSSSRR